MFRSAAGEGEAWWWLGTLATIRVPGSVTEGRYSLIEFLFGRDASPPLHSHPQDESMVILEGALTFVSGEERVVLRAGDVAVATAGTPHTFRVDSEVARLLTLSTPAGIEELPRATGVRAAAPTLPPPDAPRPSPDELARAFAAGGMTIDGAPLAPETDHPL